MYMDIVNEYAQRLQNRLDLANGIKGQEVYSVDLVQNKIKNSSLWFFAQPKFVLPESLKNRLLSGYSSTFASAIYNLAYNAIQAATTLVKGKNKVDVQIIFEQGGSNLIVRVVDNGPGLTADQLAYDDVTGRQKVVLRGGGGLFFERPSITSFETGGNPPTSSTVTVRYGQLQSLGSTGLTTVGVPSLESVVYNSKPPKSFSGISGYSRNVRSA